MTKKKVQKEDHITTTEAQEAKTEVQEAKTTTEDTITELETGSGAKRNPIITTKRSIKKKMQETNSRTTTKKAQALWIQLQNLGSLR